MKKLSVFLLLAMVAGITQVRAQACEPGPFRPAAGIQYEYSVNIASPYNESTGHYRWYVTKDPNILNYGAIIENNAGQIIAAGNYNVDPGPVVAPSIQITWTAAALAEGGPYYLVIQYWGSNTEATPGCTAMNVRVWQIDPINSFLLEIVAVDASGATVSGDAMVCAAEIESAVITPGETPTIAYTYGTNTLYYKITASGIVGDWKVSLELPDLEAGQEYRTVDWSYTIDGTGYSFGNGTSGGRFQADESVTIGDSQSVDIFVRVEIYNGTFETLANQTITIGIDGNYGPAFDMGPIWGDHPARPGDQTACDLATPYAKTASYTIAARPTINAGGGIFIQTAP